MEKESRPNIHRSRALYFSQISIGKFAIIRVVCVDFCNELARARAAIICARAPAREKNRRPFYRASRVISWNHLGEPICTIERHFFFSRPSSSWCLYPSASAADKIRMRFDVSRIKVTAREITRALNLRGLRADVIVSEKNWVLALFAPRGIVYSKPRMIGKFFTMRQ